MTLTPDQIRSWDLEPLNNIAQAWSTLGSRIDELFDEYVGAVTRVGDEYWEGITAKRRRTTPLTARRRATSSINSMAWVPNSQSGSIASTAH